jgi:hypothetical protein
MLLLQLRACAGALTTSQHTHRTSGDVSRVSVQSSRAWAGQHMAERGVVRGSGGMHIGGMLLQLCVSPAVPTTSQHMRSNKQGRESLASSVDLQQY